MVALVIETLEIYLVEIDTWSDKFEDLRGGVAVGYKAGEQVSRMSFLEHGDSPFGGNERLVIRADDGFGSPFERQFNKLPRAAAHWWGDRVRVPNRLRGHPVLTIAAMK